MTSPLDVRYMAGTNPVSEPWSLCHPHHVLKGSALVFPSSSSLEVAAAVTIVGGFGAK
eukprot:CAMPEP_0195514828 /NCGR_PEP_ID=MMETSP0794_2-20130614/6098_1 /TAXON_ID=515487 /ORGANISM="Stephanopyxis turris, Strain CCMP 815" /LENGTH=57 /DNA_ID=CAMNT_0040643153 /DNA_START=548 /DNA_END=721 /DNA_ORIENTATION=-